MSPNCLSLASSSPVILHHLVSYYPVLRRLTQPVLPAIDPSLFSCLKVRDVPIFSRYYYATRLSKADHYAVLNCQS